MIPLLETILGLVFIFLVFSLITSWIVEYLSMLYQRRGNMLYKYIREALNDNFNKNWGLMLYGHPLIEALGREVSKSGSFFGFLQNNKIGVRKRLPQYIPSEQFSVALIDLIIDNSKEAYFVKNSSGQYITVKESFVPQRSYEEFLVGLDSLNESEMKHTLKSLARTASYGADPFLSLQQEIANWYNNSMDRLNGWYKRATRKWLFITGFLVAMLFNVNALHVLKRLYTDPQLRTSVSEAAARYLVENESLPGAAIENADTLRNRISQLRETIAPLKLPVGYDYADAGFIDTLNGYRQAIAEAFPGSFLGWLLTALAVSFGAPFWFDLLKGFANVRSTGIVPPTAGNRKLKL